MATDTSIDEFRETDPEQAACNPIRVLCAKFIPSRRAISYGKPRPVQAVVRYNDRLILLFPNGRWTMSGDVSWVYPYAAHREEAKKKSRRYRVIGGNTVNALEIGEFLPVLVHLGLLAETEREAFISWRSETLDAKYAAEELAQLTREVERLGASVVKDAEELAMLREQVKARRDLVASQRRGTQQ